MSFIKIWHIEKSVSQGKVVVIRMGNLQDGEIRWDDLAYSNDEEDIEKYRLFSGDVLLIGQTVRLLLEKHQYIAEIILLFMQDILLNWIMIIHAL